MLYSHFSVSRCSPDCVGLEVDWTALKKQEFDNMSAYLASKEERIREKQAKKWHQQKTNKDAVIKEEEDDVGEEEEEEKTANGAGPKPAKLLRKDTF